MKEGYGERRITQLKELKTLLWGLDLDEGIRFIAEVPGFSDPCFVFITRCDDKICVSIKERIFDKSLNQFVPGGNEQWQYFNTPDEAWNHVEKFLKAPIEAFYY